MEMVLREDGLIVWAYFPNAISDDVVDEIVKSAEPLTMLSEQRHFVQKGKVFFKTTAGLGHLTKIIHNLKGCVDFSSYMSNPVIHHAYLLYKSSGGPATHMHQDRPYWVNVEKNPTMVTVWLFLEDIGPKNGCLRLNFQNKFDLSEGYFFNRDQNLLSHEDSPAMNGFNKVIPQKDAKVFEDTLEPVSGRKGDVVIFDGFELHASMPNSVEETRKALKIVIGDDLEDFFISIPDIEKNGLFKIAAKNKYKTLKKKIWG